MAEERDWADVIYENRKAIVAAVIGIVVAVVLFGLFKHMRTKKAEEAAYYFSKGLEVMFSSGKEKDLKGALEYFRKAEKVGVGKEAKLAKIMEGRILIEMGKEKEGRAIIKKALSGIKGSYLEPVLLSDTMDEAVFKEYLSRDNPFLEDYVRFQLAMLYLNQGKKEEAKKELLTLKGKFPSSPFSRDAERILEVLR